MIKKNIIDEIKSKPLIFAEILKRSNTGNTTLQPDTLKRRLERYSENVRTSVIIADYFREKGYTDKEIFEK